MQKTRRIAGIVFAGILLVAIVGYLSLRMYLSSDSVKELASAKLTEKFGGDVRVTDLTSDFSSTTMQVEIPGAPSEAPLIRGRVHVDVSPIGLAAGSEPKVIRIDNANVNLHLDRDGNLLGKLPQLPGGSGGSVPTIDIKNATIHMVQDGKPDFHIAGVDVNISEKESKLIIVGLMKDAEFGEWTATGNWAANGSSGTVTMETIAAVRVTPTKLKSIPFVPLDTWSYVELDGRTTAKVTVGRAADTKWNWRIECEPTDTLLKVFPIDLEATQTNGKVIVDGALVTLAGVQGNAAGGKIETDAVLDFSGKSTVLDFKKLNGIDIDVKKTPASWKLAGRVDEGRLNGQGQIKLTIEDGLFRTEGKWKTVLTGKVFRGGIVMKLLLKSDGKRLRFEDDPDAAQLIPDGGAAPLLNILLATLLQPYPVPIQKAETETQYARANLKLTDIDIAELIAKAELASSVNIVGKITLDLSAEIPLNNADQLKAYRAKGKLSSSSLRIQDLLLSGVAADVELRDGILKLTKFAAQFPKEALSKAGSFSGTATFGIEPRTALVADLNLDEIPLRQIFAAIPGLKDKAEGVFSGDFKLKIPGDKLSNVKSYVASGKLTATSLKAFGQKAEKVAIEVNLNSGVAEVTKAEADFYSGSIRGAAKWPLVGPAAGTYSLRFTGLDSAALVKAIPDSPVKLSGKIDGKIDGTLPSAEGFDSAKITANLDITSAKLVVQGIPSTKLIGKLGYKLGAITYDLKGAALGGSFDVEGTYPIGTQPDPKKIHGGSIRIERIQLNRIARDLRIDSLRPLTGTLNLTVKFTYGADGPVGSGRLEVRDFGWGDELFDTSDLASDIRVDSDGIEIQSLNGELAGGNLRGRVRYDFDDPRRSTFNLRLNNANASTLLTSLGLSSDTGRIAISLRGSIGKQLRGTGTISAARLKLDGVDIADVRIPLTWQFNPGGVAQLAIRDASATIANGRVTARTDITWNGSARVDGRIEFVDVNVSDLAEAFGSSTYGVGKTTGRFDFSGNEVRTAADLKGNLTARFGKTSVRELPIFGSITTLLSPVQALTSFESGELSANLGSGLFRIERFSLASAGAKLFADGTVGLDGKLDLDLAYNTRQVGPSAPLIRLILRDIPAIGPIPVGLIVRISESLSNRIVRLHIEGTTDRPAIRVNAAKLLSENAVRFFVGQYVPLSGVSK